MNNYQTLIALSRYARWLPEENRRETWPETVARYFDFMEERIPDAAKYRKRLEKLVVNLEVMPSMRALMTAGPALERENVAGYNCSYLPVDHPRAFDETMYILMCGTGVGFSVERQYVSQLPDVPRELVPSETCVVVEDSKEGWARGLKQLVSLLYSGEIPGWDVSRVRPAGARLETFGGRASGPEPLERLFRFVVDTFKKAQGRKLTSLECHDIMCKIGEVVVVGGVRRSAMISLSNLSDDRMRAAKSGAWYVDNIQRALANNSACYVERPDLGVFMDEWKALYESGSGERGIFNRQASQRQAARNGRRDPAPEFGTNPCSEIILRPYQFCNLTEVVVRPHDTKESLTEKVQAATILGTWQATLTNFKYLRAIWRRNTEEERLLGVSLTGIYDGPVGLFEWLVDLKEEAIATNKYEASRLGIPQSTAVTCVKPSGTVSQLVDSASGIHPRHSKYYIRRIRGDAKDPLSQFMKDAGIPCEPDVTKPNDTWVFSFPVASPFGSNTRDDLSAIDQLEAWKAVQRDWCEHKPSITVSVRDHEWLEVAAWVWENFDIISGVSFLPHSDHKYDQAPYEEIDEARYKEMLEKMPKKIHWNILSEYEKEDNTTGSQELACASGMCEIVQIGPVQE